MLIAGCGKQSHATRAETTTCLEAQGFSILPVKGDTFAEFAEEGAVTFVARFAPGLTSGALLFEHTHGSAAFKLREIRDKGLVQRQANVLVFWEVRPAGGDRKRFLECLR